jgi:nucleoside-diphosphate-sugar epimerase
MTSDFLIVGCTSAVGSRLLIKLLDQGYSVDGIRLNSDCKIKSKLHNCEPLDFLSTDPRIIVSKYPSSNLIMASWITTPGVFWESPLNSKWAEAYKDLMTAFRDNGGSKVVGIGSCAEYKFESSTALSEESVTDPKSAYGKAKLEVFHFLNQLELEFVWVRTFFQYGPEDNDAKFIVSLLNAFQKNLDFDLRDPEGLRDYVFIDDVVEVLYRLIAKGSKGVFNIGTGHSVSGYEVASIARDAMGRRGKILVSQDGSQVSNIFASTEKLEKEIGPVEWSDIESGIRQVIAVRTNSLRGKDTK